MGKQPTSLPHHQAVPALIAAHPQPQLHPRRRTIATLEGQADTANKERLEGVAAGIGVLAVIKRGKGGMQGSTLSTDQAQPGPPCVHHKRETQQASQSKRKNCRMLSVSTLNVYWPKSRNPSSSNPKRHALCGSYASMIFFCTALWASTYIGD